MPASTIVFDFDGTLHDTMRVYLAALQRGYDWLVEQGLAPARELGVQDAQANIGLTAEEAWARMCPQLGWEVTGKAASQVGTFMDELMHEGHARLFDGAAELLDTLLARGHKLVFLSNCRNSYRDAARAAFGLDRWFCAYYTAEQFDRAPKEEIFKTVRQEVAGPYIVVGDRDKDLAIARVHGLPSIGCLYGYSLPGELEGATFLASQPDQIAGLVERIEASRKEEAQ